MTPNRLLGLALAVFVFALDQGVKYVIRVPLDLRGAMPVDVLPIFRLIWVENYGVSLGLLTAHSEAERWALTGVTAAIALCVTTWLWREQNRQDVFGLGLILGGALGNITDRVRFGYVIDYADLHFGEFHPFLVFNIADAAITIGVIILLFRALLARDTPKASENA